jgi:DNA polymerase I-like protein with 3'-5' exonuclease and polymerase domains
MEIEIVQPKIVVAMGVPAMHYFGITDSMEHVHGKPVEMGGRVILPAYHPAAALRDTSKMRQVSDDFQVLRGLVKGRDWREYHVKDEYPDPKYVVVDTPDKVKMMEYLIEQAGEFAIDTEICRGKLWSVQISCKEGEAFFIPVRDDHQGRVDLSHLRATAIVHNYLFDIQYLKLSETDFADTMTLAYLTGEPQGLKELANRLCGIQMINYNEMVRSGQRSLSFEYLLKASGMEWPDPPTIEETKWDNKKGCLVTKNKKPWHISRKINKILQDAGYAVNDKITLDGVLYDFDVDMWDRWRNIPEEERAVVEDVIGAMPESSLVDIPFDDAVRYASRDADATLRVYHKLQKMITDLDLDFVLDMDLNILPMVNSMMQNGMAVDIDHFRKLSEDYDVRMRVMSEELAGQAGHSFNPNSSDQVAEVIYKELGFKPTKTTPTGKISTDDAELKKTGHPIAKGVIRYRGIQKLKSTYADSLIEWARPDTQGIPRVHTTLKTTRVETGRLASADPNLQNIPTRNKEAKVIKNGFIAPPGKRMVEADYSQIEMVTLAHLSNCRRLVELFNRGGDPHTEMAAEVFGLPKPKYEDGVADIASESKYRYPVKRLNFGIAYLIGGHGLSTQLHEYVADLEMEGEPVDIEPWDELTCEKFIAEWYKLNPEVKDFQLERAAEARRRGYVRDPLSGRIRYIPEITCPISAIAEGGARMAANFPVTCSAQTIIKTAMGQLWRELPRTPWVNDVEWIMQVHDSLITYVTDDDDIAIPFYRWMLSVMTGVYKLRVPIKADLKAGYRWAELQKVKL